MAKKNVNYYLLKTARWSGWLLLPLMILYILTGFSLCGKFGFSELIAPETARDIHQIFEWPLVGLFLLHCSTTIYFALRRWGWIGKRTYK